MAGWVGAVEVAVAAPESVDAEVGTAGTPSERGGSCILPGGLGVKAASLSPPPPARPISRRVLFEGGAAACI